MAKLGYEVNTTADKDTGIITHEVISCAAGYEDDNVDTVRETITRQVLETQTEQVKKALIELGWTPPRPFKPTHQHAEGGLYEVLNSVRVHVNGTWKEGRRYRCQFGLEYVRELGEFLDRFTPL